MSLRGGKAPFGLTSPCVSFLLCLSLSAAVRCFSVILSAKAPNTTSVPILQLKAHCQQWFALQYCARYVPWCRGAC